MHDCICDQNSAWVSKEPCTGKGDWHGHAVTRLETGAVQKVPTGTPKPTVHKQPAGAEMERGGALIL